VQAEADAAIAVSVTAAARSSAAAAAGGSAAGSFVAPRRRNATQAAPRKTKARGACPRPAGDGGLRGNPLLYHSAEVAASAAAAATAGTVFDDSVVTETAAAGEKAAAATASAEFRRTVLGEAAAAATATAGNSGFLDAVHAGRRPGCQSLTVPSPDSAAKPASAFEFVAGFGAAELTTAAHSAQTSKKPTAAASLTGEQARGPDSDSAVARFESAEAAATAGAGPASAGSPIVARAEGCDLFSWVWPNKSESVPADAIRDRSCVDERRLLFQRLQHLDCDSPPASPQKLCVAGRAAGAAAAGADALGRPSAGAVEAAQRADESAGDAAAAEALWAAGAARSVGVQSLEVAAVVADAEAVARTAEVRSSKAIACLPEESAAQELADSGCSDAADARTAADATANEAADATRGAVAAQAAGAAPGSGDVATTAAPRRGVTGWRGLSLFSNIMPMRKRARAPG